MPQATFNLYADSKRRRCCDIWLVKHPCHQSIDVPHWDLKVAASGLIFPEYSYATPCRRKPSSSASRCVHTTEVCKKVPSAIGAKLWSWPMNKHNHRPDAWFPQTRKAPREALVGFEVCDRTSGSSPRLNVEDPLEAPKVMDNIPNGISQQRKERVAAQKRRFFCACQAQNAQEKGVNSILCNVVLKSRFPRLLGNRREVQKYANHYGAALRWVGFEVFGTDGYEVVAMFFPNSFKLDEFGTFDIEDDVTRSASARASKKPGEDGHRKAAEHVGLWHCSARSCHCTHTVVTCSHMFLYALRGRHVHIIWYVPACIFLCIIL